MARARQLLREAVYDPATVALLEKVFDEAWAVVAPNYTAVMAVETARVQLANIILSLAAEGERDPQRLKDRAIGTLSAVGAT